MKKVVAFGLLLIFLFNIGGYSVLYWMANRQASKELTAKLDRDEFSGSETITIKVPISLPYQPDRDYERVNGEFEYDGQFYKLVKQRVLGDTLYVVCIVDNKKKELVDEMNKFTRNSTESPVNQPLKVSSNNPVQDYSNGHAVQLISLSSGWSISFGSCDTIHALIQSAIDANSPPPWC